MGFERRFGTRSFVVLCLALVLVIALEVAARALVAPVLSGTVLSDTSVRLDWTDAGDEQKYFVYRDNVKIATLNANVLTFTNTGLTPNTTYAYKIGAKKGGTELQSNTVPLTTTGGPPPTGCQGLTVPLGSDLRTVIAANGPGTTYCLQAGTYTVLETADNSELRMETGDVVWGAGQGVTVIDAADSRTNIVGGAGGIAHTYTFRDLTLGYSGAHVDPSCTTPGGCGNAFTSGKVTLLNMRCHDMGTLCINISVVSLLADNVECDRNGWFSFQGDKASCFKAGSGAIPEPVNITVRNSNIHDNYGVGVWFDFCSSNGFGCMALVEDNQIVNNASAGILWEVSGNFNASDSLTVRRNVIQTNGWNYLGRAAGAAGVALTDSSRADIGPSNVFGGNQYLITQTGQLACCRAVVSWEGTRDPAAMFGIVVHDNTLNGDQITYTCPPHTCTNNTP